LALFVQILKYEDNICPFLYSNNSLLTESLGIKITRTFSALLKQILHEPQTLVKDLTFIDALDLKQVQIWNDRALVADDTCLHYLIENMVVRQNDADAIDAWDGHLTYGALDDLSSRFAQVLVRSGVTVGTFVPFCFEKSLWVVVATLAVLKAGAAFVPLDHMYPIERLKAILEDTKSTFVITSEKNADLFHGLVSNVVVVSQSTVPKERVLEKTTVAVTPSHPAYILFTSGSTGRPKGIVHEHAAVCTNVLCHGQYMGYCQESRVLQFSAHTFDVALMDIFTTLVQGGCVCIPSEADREDDIIGFMNRKQVNFALITPSLASLIKPKDVPTLKDLSLGGEAVTWENLKVWKNKVRLSNCYGPSECGVCLVENFTSDRDRQETLGFPLPKSRCWIVHTEDHNKLMPIGAVGELLVESPSLARYYLNNTEKTESTFIYNPTWSQTKDSRRFYKTRDLVRYNIDGSIDFLGRIDTQIKLRGQRIELGEVEHHLSMIPDILVSMVTLPKTGCFANTLVVVAQFEKSESIRFQDYSSKDFGSWSYHHDGLRLINRQLKRVVPLFMLPTACIGVQKMPFNNSLKVDKRKINLWLEALPSISQEDMSFQDVIGEFQPLEEGEHVAHDISSYIARVIARRDNQRQKFFEAHDYPLHLTGMTSIDFMSLSIHIKKTFQIGVPMDFLTNSQTTIRALAKVVQGGSQELDTKKVIKSNLETEISERWRKLKSLADKMVVKAPPSKIKNILLTGATRGLGLELLKKLLNLSNSRIIILVRDNDKSMGLQRIVNVAIEAGWWNPVFMERIGCWKYDLKDTLSQLDETQSKAIFGQNAPEQNIHAIIHCGAQVHWAMDYRSLMRVNVNSTFEFLSMALSSPSIVDFTYISGGLLLSSDDDIETNLINRAAESDGYSQTKLVSEILTQRLQNIPTTLTTRVIKPGYIIGAAAGGRANSTDFIWRLARTCIDMRAYNQDDVNSWLYIADAESISNITLSHMWNEDSKTTKILSGVQIQDFWDCLSEFGYNFDELRGSDWLVQLRCRIESDGESHPLYPLMHVLERDNGRFGADQQPNTIDPNLKERVKIALHENIKYLSTIGYFPDPAIRSGIPSEY